jgi:gamma-glutamyltranspeptidase / glutathione hydrolase
MSTHDSPVDGGVVAAVQQYAADAGAEILAAGGNAADAAAAAVLAQGVVDPYRCGIGGGGVALVLDGGSGATSVLSFYGYAPAAARSDMYEPAGHRGTLFQVKGEANQFGYRASVVPGLIRGLAELHSSSGSGQISWARLFEPAIRLACDGFLVYPFLARGFLADSDVPFQGVARRTCTYSAAAAQIFAPDGEFPRLGQCFRQADYGATLSRIAEQGADEFYEGETAERIVADCAAHDGLLTADDLRSFRPAAAPVLEGSYRGLRLLTESAPSVGPTLLQYLNVLEGWDLPSLGWNSYDYAEHCIRALNLVFQDRMAHIADPDSVAVPLDWLLSAENARAHRVAIEAAMAGAAMPELAATVGPGTGSKETTHTTVVDNKGNAVLVTHSSGSSSGVVTPGLGFLHNNHMTQFDPTPGRPNSIAPGKRPNIGGGPVLVFGDEGLSLAMGSPAGGYKVSAMAQSLIGIVDFGFDAQDAVAADRFHAEDVPLLVDLDPRFNPRTATELAAAGYDVTFSEYGARIAAVQRSPDGELTGLADPRGDCGIATV